MGASKAIFALALLAACLHGAQGAGDFVTISGNTFTTSSCKDFAVSGWNSWQVIESAGGICCGGLVNLRQQFDKAATANFNVARMFGFVVQQGYNQQITPSADPTKIVYNETILKAFDQALVELSNRNIKAIVALANNWNYNGNMSDCKDWYTNNTKGATNPDDFWTNPTTISYYLANAQAIMSRKNSITGVAYNQDPTIMGWDLINEGRCEYTGCTAAGLYSWFGQVAPKVKSYAPKQLITTGIDGFYQQSNCASNTINPVPNSDGWPLRTGQDFLPNHDLAGIDYASMHCWPDNWGRTDQPFGIAWVNNHIAQTQQYLKMPLLLEEFGKAVTGPEGPSGVQTEQARTQYYADIYAVTENSINVGNALRGVLFWRWDAVDNTATFNGFDNNATLLSSSQAYTDTVLPFSSRIAQRCPSALPHMAGLAPTTTPVAASAGRKLQQIITVPAPQAATTTQTPSTPSAVATPAGAQAAVPVTGVASTTINGMVSGSACTADTTVPNTAG